MLRDLRGSGIPYANLAPETGVEHLRYLVEHSSVAVQT